MTKEDSRTLFAAHNRYGHAKESARKLTAVWVRAWRKVLLTSFRPNKFKNGGVKGLKIINLPVAPTHLGPPLNVMFLRVITACRIQVCCDIWKGGTCTFFVRVMNLESIQLKQINYLQDGSRTFL
jgi:hypothetical protein